MGGGARMVITWRTSCNLPYFFAPTDSVSVTSLRGRSPFLRERGTRSPGLSRRLAGSPTGSPDFLLRKHVSALWSVFTPLFVEHVRPALHVGRSWSPAVVCR